jgi:hypothetical protein
MRVCVVLRTSRLFSLLPQSLLKRALFLEVRERPERRLPVRMVLRAVILREDAVALRVEDQERLDAVQ